MQKHSLYREKEMSIRQTECSANNRDNSSAEPLRHVKICPASGKILFYQKTIESGVCFKFPQNNPT
jgi:hypothetical protein